MVGDAAAANVINNVNAAFGSGSVGGNSSFTVNIGAMLTKALTAAPFKILDDMINGEVDRRR